MDFGICPTKTGDVRLISGFIEPAEHGVKLFTQDEPDEGHRKFLKLHRLAKTRLKTLAASGLVNSLPAISSSFPMNSVGRSKARATNAPMSSVAMVWYGLSARTGSASLPFRRPISTWSM